MKKILVQLEEGGKTLLKLELDTNADVPQVLSLVNGLAISSQPNMSDTLVSSLRESRKYGALAAHLKQATVSPLELSFQEIETLIGSALPASAREHRAWWANSDSHVQARVWMAMGWRMASVDMAAQTVTFRKEA